MDLSKRIEEVRLARVEANRLVIDYDQQIQALRQQQQIEINKTVEFIAVMKELNKLQKEGYTKVDA